MQNFVFLYKYPLKNALIYCMKHFSGEVYMENCPLIIVY